MNAGANIADALFARAAEAPERVAIHAPHGRDGYRATTYRELAADVDAAAAGLAAIGIARGMRVALMVTPGVEFFVLVFALFRAGAVPVLIDPGIDRRALKQCLDEAAPEAFIGIPRAHAARIALRWAHASVRVLVTVGRRWFWGGYTYDEILARGRRFPLPFAEGEGGGGVASSRDAPLPNPPLQAGEGAGAEGEEPLAAILFTSGSTGVPKGVEYTHANFAAQVAMLRDAFDVRSGEVDLPTFAPFALFDPALGMTTVLPRMDFARPGRADPRVLVDAVRRFGVTTMFGSPAVLAVLARHDVPLPGVKRVISAGAPVRPQVVAAMRALLDDDATIWTPYGATECLPVAIVEGREILAIGADGTARGDGILVGRPVAPNVVRVVATSDAAIPRWDDALAVPDGTVGEITVAGPTATRRYFRRDAATRLAKIDEPGAHRIVHRMGDLGWFDAHGRLWYVGRKSHRVVTAAGTLHPEQAEGILNMHPDVRRTALVGIGPAGAQVPVACVELRDRVAPGEWPRVARELAALAASHEKTRAIARFLRHDGFPVDIRHNAKIGREALARWAATQPAEAAP